MKNTMEYPPEVQQVRAAWKASGMQQPSFAKACGVSHGVMLQILTNGYYSKAKLEMVQAALTGLPTTPVVPAPPTHKARGPVMAAAPMPVAAPSAPAPDTCPPVETTTSPKYCWMKPAAPAMSEHVKAASAELKEQLAGAQVQVTEARVSLGAVKPGSAHERTLTQALTLISQVRFAVNQGEL